VALDYDPLLAKLVGYGENREQVIARLSCALDEYFVGRDQDQHLAVPPNLTNPDFAAAKLDTGFLDECLIA